MLCAAAEAVSSSGYRSPGAGCGSAGGGAVISLDSPSPPAPASPPPREPLPERPHLSITPVAPASSTAQHHIGNITLITLSSTTTAYPPASPQVGT